MHRTLHLCAKFLQPSPFVFHPLSNFCIRKTANICSRNFVEVPVLLHARSCPGSHCCIPLHWPCPWASSWLLASNWVRRRGCSGLRQLQGLHLLAVANLKPVAKLKPLTNLKPFANLKPVANLKPFANLKPVTNLKPAVTILKPAVAVVTAEIDMASSDLLPVALPGAERNVQMKHQANLAVLVQQLKLHSVLQLRP